MYLFYISGELKTGFTFIVDKRGDPDLVTYGTTHTYGIPSFRRSGSRLQTLYSI